MRYTPENRGYEIQKVKTAYAVSKLHMQFSRPEKMNSRIHVSRSIRIASNAQMQSHRQQKREATAPIVSFKL